MAKTVAKETAVQKPAKGLGAVAGKRSVVEKLRSVAVDEQVMAHGLNGLLHSMQAVQQSEETLCSLMHALRRGRATGALLRELRDVLEQLPAQDYLHEVHALREAVAA